MSDGVPAVGQRPRSAVPVRGDCSASRPKHNPPCRVAVDGLIDEKNSEGEVDEPGASLGEDVEKSGDNRGSSKMR